MDIDPSLEELWWVHKGGTNPSADGAVTMESHGDSAKRIAIFKEWLLRRPAPRGERDGGTEGRHTSDGGVDG